MRLTRLNALPEESIFRLPGEKRKWRVSFRIGGMVWAVSMTGKKMACGGSELVEPITVPVVIRGRYVKARTKN